MRIYFTGCSFTMGSGFDHVQNDLRIYPNLVCSNYNAECINQAEGGSNNQKIFLRAAKAIIDQTADVYVVQWSALHRHWVYPAPDRGIYMGAPHEPSRMQKFIAQYQLLNHDFSNIMLVIDYTRILESLAAAHHVKLVFVNGLIPWTEDLLTQNNYGKYAQELFKDLKFNDVQEFRNRLTNNLELINWQLWANPWTSMRDMQQDNAPLDDHPGEQTHCEIADKIITVLEKINN